LSSKLEQRGKKRLPSSTGMNIQLVKSHFLNCIPKKLCTSATIGRHHPHSSTNH
jgi:hypothetical protein